MFRTLIYPSSEACDYSVEYHIGRIVLGSMCVGVDDEYINVRNMLST